MADAVTKLSPAIDDLSSARRTLATEIEGLNALAKSLDQNFVKAIEVIQAMKDKGRGRLIVAGIGKSGHIARKIAAICPLLPIPATIKRPRPLSFMA